MVLDINKNPKSDMGIFSRFRKRGDVIDLTELQRRGLLKIPEKAPEYVEISKQTGSVSQEQSSPFGFFGAIANSTSSTTEQTNSYNNSSDSLNDSFESRKERLRRRFAEIQDKVERTLSDVYELKHRLELIEKKLERIERKEGIKTY